MDIGTAIGALSRLRTWACTWICGSESDRQLKRVRQQRLTSLVEEIHENQVRASHPLHRGLVLVRFQLAAWDAAREDMEAYPPDLRDKLRTVYGTLRECNQLADHFEVRGDGGVQNVFERRVTEVRSALEELHRMLQRVRFAD
jgi:hypothetical protein